VTFTFFLLCFTRFLELWCVLLMLVAGVRMSPNPLGDMIGNVVTQCSDHNTDCYLVDDGAVIVHSDADDKIVKVRGSQ